MIDACLSRTNNYLIRQLAEQYGDDVASDVMARSRSNLQVDSQYGSVRGSETPGPQGYNQSTFNSQGGYGTVPHGGSDENVRR